MRFRTALLIGILGLVAATTLTAVTAVSLIIERSARSAIGDDLRRSDDVFAELRSFHDSLLTVEARMLASEPRLRALLETADISPETVRDVALEIGQALGTESFLVAFADGTVMIDLSGTHAVGASLGQDRVIARALASGGHSGLWIRQGEVLQVRAQSVVFGGAILGVVVVGRPLGGHTMKTAQHLTGSAVIIELDERPLPHSTLAGRVIEAGSWAPVSEVVTGAQRAHEVVIAGEDYLVIAAPFSEEVGSRRLRYVILRSLEQALSPKRELQRIALLGIALALPLAILLAVFIARRLSQPIDQLVAFTDRIGAGDLQARAAVRGTSELQTLAGSMNHMAMGLQESQQAVVAKERLEQEMQVAALIQTSILPRVLAAPGLAIAAEMIPATEVGGDYYDVLPTGDGTWIAIGDVAGHGVPAGMIMLMVQNVIAAMTRARPAATPSELYCAVNRVLVDHVRQRMQRDDHVTLTLMHHDGQGAFTFAGAHEDIVVWRAATGQCERIETPGTWLAVMDEIEEFIDTSELRLQPGDVMVLYTDGVTEAMNEDREQYGLDRLCDALAQLAGKDVETVCQQLVAEVLDWTHEQDDDVSMMVIRRLPA